MAKVKTPSEKDLETELRTRIESNRKVPCKIVISTPDGNLSIAELLGNHDPEILQDNSDWNRHIALSVDIFGGITPDLVLRSRLSGENRIIIEVKKASKFTHDEPDASQVLRYFLHLLTTTNQNEKHKGQKDIRRAILLAAPQSWFDNKKVSAPWNHFLKTYGPLAKQFKIVVGEIILEPMA